MRLLKKGQWNSIIEAIEKAGFDPRDFDLDDDGDEARISPRRSEGVFVIRQGDAGGYDVHKAVGEQAPTGYPVHSWNGVKSPPLFIWLTDLKQDQETPDRFAELRHEREMLTNATAEDVENTPFTAGEQAEIRNQLQQIKAYVEKTYELSEDQVQALEAGLDEIRDAAGRLRRRDWLAYVAGTLTILEATVLPPETTRHILLMLLRSLGQMRGYVFPELPGNL